MNQVTINNRFDLATAIGLFLVGKGLKVWDRWEGRLTAKEQRESFGVYMGKGLIIVDGENDTLSMIVKICFGQDIQTMVHFDAKDPKKSFHNYQFYDGKRYAELTRVLYNVN